MQYGEVIQNNIYYEKIYGIFTFYYNNPIMTKMYNYENYGVYYCKIKFMLGLLYRYIIVFVENDTNNINSELNLENLKWSSFQTRTIKDNHDIPIYNYIKPKSIPPELLYTIIKSDTSKDGENIYTCSEFPIEIELLTTERVSTYSSKGNILQSLEIYQTIINLI
jgi:hypothetical protein